MSAAAIEAFQVQAAACEDLGSPFTARLCRLLAARLDHTTRFGHKILTWSGDPAKDALALRACAALHALARSWKEPELNAAYPPAPFDEQRLWHLIVDVLTRHDNFLANWLDRPPQTNEVARSALVLGAALIVTARTRLPIDLYEIGASAGLNLVFDQYRYALGGRSTWSRGNSPLTISCDWRGALPPLSARVSIAARRGCDRNPLDPASEDDSSRLLAYVWADQTARLARLGTALKLAGDSGIRVEQAEAADWVEQQLLATPQEGVCRMLYHTIVWQYLADDQRTRIEKALTRAGSAATDETPLAHFAFEADDAGEGGRMTLTMWPGGDPVTIGRADFHGRWATWSEVDLL